MPYTTAAKNRMLDALARNVAPGAGIATVSLHTADPGSTGASEVTGGLPAYARKAITWNAATGGSIDDSTSSIVFDVPGSTTVAHVGFWSGDATPVFLGSNPVTPNEVFASQGTFTVTDADLNLNAA